ncbi:hypothetical protein LTR84_002822 [Exophiala bonariae]|uniref:UBC core domain-containing protein n=1 Tax=Exophiala bonariae TaxID=1690606 RepID=A0AAV9N8Z2_9EURO|nr:hypothetical protein LTR84_002822 [Exophiala bonariae]
MSTSTSTAPLLPTFRRQQLVLDFSSLRDECPDGIYLSLVPGKPSLWGGVFFVRNGPYAEAILRFQLSFPDTYPSTPPLVTFSTDVFHPLVVPMTTYTFSANVDTSSTVSASDEHRLPPGAFSLRYGFPDWFAQGGTLNDTSMARKTENESEDAEIAQVEGGKKSTQDPSTLPSSPERIPAQKDRKSTLLSLLHHINASFSDPSVLDALPLASAGNPGAWHAWRAHRNITNPTSSTNTATGADTLNTQTPGSATGSLSSTSPSSPKNPAAWKWDGVWESRVDSAIRESIAENTLFGSSGATGASGPATLGMGLFAGARGDSSGSRFGTSPGGAFGGMGSSAAGGVSNLDDRQRSQALADRQIRFAKLPDDGLLDVRRRVGLAASVVEGGR